MVESYFCFFQPHWSTSKNKVKKSSTLLECCLFTTFLSAQWKVTFFRRNERIDDNFLMPLMKKKLYCKFLAVVTFFWNRPQQFLLLTFFFVAQNVWNRILAFFNESKVFCKVAKDCFERDAKRKVVWTKPKTSLFFKKN